MRAVKAPSWFKVVSIFLFIWNILGLLSFFTHVFITDEMIATYSEAEQNLYTEYPLWTNIVFAVATITGFLGALLLLIKKKIAKTLFLISLLAIIPQMIHNLFFTSSIEVYGAIEAFLMPLIVIVLGILSIYISHVGNKKDWLV